jgi:pimeloyl-ACP methyl ester carboxylesterase
MSTPFRMSRSAAREARAGVAALSLAGRPAPQHSSPEAAEAAARTAIEKNGYAAFSATLFGEMFVPGSVGAAQILARVAGKPADVPTALWPRSARWDAGQLEGALAAVRAPVLAIQSTTRDPASLRRTSLKPGESSAWLDLLRRKLDRVRIEIIPSVGHFTGLDAPERVNRLISGFAAACR